MDNCRIAQWLLAEARALERWPGSLYRRQAYRRAALTIQGLDEPLEAIWARGGRQALAALPGIGAHLACALERLLRTGQWRPLAPAEVPLEKHICRLPGIGPVLAERLADAGGIVTLDDLEQAEASGRLDQLGLSQRQLRQVRRALGRRRAPPSPRSSANPAPGLRSRPRACPLDYRQALPRAG
jgi:DNA polymerase/3'-5' exonuclease PolX